jgi:hypothetical protein
MASGIIVSSLFGGSFRRVGEGERALDAVERTAVLGIERAARLALQIHRRP